MKKLLLLLMRATLNRPTLAHRIDAVLLRFPLVRGRLLRMASGGGLFAAPETAGAQTHRPFTFSDSTAFEDFVQEHLEFKSGTLLLPNALHVHLGPEYFNPVPGVARLAGLQLDYQLIDCIRHGQAIHTRKAIDQQVDRHQLDLLMDHIYLALLRRYPSQAVRQAGVRELIGGRTVEAVIERIRMSAEYRALHRQGLPQ